MKTIATCLGRYQEAIGKLTEAERGRAAYKSTGTFGENITIKIWPARIALRKTLAMQANTCSWQDNWIAVEKFDLIY